MDKTYIENCGIEMKTVEQYFPLMLFSMLHKIVLLAQQISLSVTILMKYV